MPLFAVNKKGSVISALSAVREQDFFCRECGEKLGLRAGERKRRHFFHLQVKNCSSGGKGALHHGAQMGVCALLPDGEAVLERIFPEIGHIADVAWEKEHLIFEVQCSAISAKEVQKRNKAYAKIGWQVVWLLHTCRYGLLDLTEAEMVLRNSPHYYCSFNEKGEGRVIDRSCFGFGSRVLEEIRVSPVDIGKPIRKKKTLIFSGDVENRVDRDKNLLKVLLSWKRKKRMQEINNFFYPIYDRYLRRPILSLLSL